MPLTVTDQIAADPYLARLDGVLTRDLEERRRARWQGRRGDGGDRLELLQTRTFRVRAIREAWTHGSGTLTAEEGAALVIELDAFACTQGRSASATIVSDEDGLRIVFAGGRKPHALSLDHSTPERIWAHWRGYVGDTRVLSFAAVKAELRGLGVLVVRLRGEYRVRLLDQPAGEGYHTADLADALATGRDLARRAKID